MYIGSNDFSLCITSGIGLFLIVKTLSLFSIIISPYEYDDMYVGRFNCWSLMIIHHNNMIDAVRRIL